jgi:hypothetical protein
MALIEHLPSDSATAFSVVGDPSRWGPGEYLLADVFDVLAAANWQRAGDKNKTRPKPYPRPRSKQATEALGRQLKRLKGVSK